MIVTAHPSVDHGLLARRVRLVVDLRGVTRGSAPQTSSGCERSRLRRRHARSRAAARGGGAGGEGVSFGAYVVVHAGTVIGEGCSIEDHAVLGKRPQLARHSSARGDVGALELGAGASVGTGAVVFAGASIASAAILGDQSFVRERASIGAGSVIGRGSVVDNDVVVGARVRVQTNVYLTAFTLVEDDVFVGPGAITTNDDTMARHGGGRASDGGQDPIRGAILRRAFASAAGRF